MTTAVAPPDRAPRPRRAFELAALAVAAVPGLEPVSVVATRPTRDGIDTAVIRDSTARDWVVTAPRDDAAGAELEAELAVLNVLIGRIPFTVPIPQGQAALRRGGRAVVWPAIEGAPLVMSDLRPHPELAASIGKAVAAVHNVDVDAFVQVGVPVYDGEGLRRRSLALLDRGADTGVVPAGLLSRWESRIEDVSRWRFAACPVHGELLADRVLVSGDRVTAVLDWSGARVSDPAEDLAWLAIGADPAALQVVVDAYANARGAGLDRHLVDRAVVHGEMALMSWLLHGRRIGDQSIVTDARTMLSELAAWHEDNPDEAPATVPVEAMPVEYMAARAAAVDGVRSPGGADPAAADDGPDRQAPTGDTEVSAGDVHASDDDTDTIALNTNATEDTRATAGDTRTTGGDTRATAGDTEGGIVAARPASDDLAALAPDAPPVRVPVEVDLREPTPATAAPGAGEHVGAGERR